jgi:ribosome-binding factor A
MARKSGLKLFVSETGIDSSQRRRSCRIASKIQECIAMSLLRDNFPIVALPSQCLITLTHVDVSADLRNASVYFVLSDDSKKQDAMDFLVSHIGYFKTALSCRIRLRYVPNIDFKFDETLEHARKIDRLLGK